MNGRNTCTTSNTLPVTPTLPRTSRPGPGPQHALVKQAHLESGELRNIATRHSVGQHDTTVFLGGGKIAFHFKRLEEWK